MSNLDSSIDFTVAPRVGAAGVVYPYEHQQADNWCWDACTLMVLEYYSLTGTGIQQCQIAQRFLGVAGCCTSPLPGACDQGYAADGIAGIYAQYSVDATYYSSAVAETDLKSELDAKRPVEVMYSWNTSGAHVALVFGYYVDASGVTMYRVSDPWYGQRDHIFSDIANAYGMGVNSAYWNGVKKATAQSGGAP